MHRRLVGAGLLTAVLFLSGCRATIAVRLTTTNGTSGQISVKLALDKQASSAIGGARAISVEDLEANGWRVTEKAGTPDASGAALVISAVKAFASAPQAVRILEQVSGSAGTPGILRDFELVSNRGLIRDHTAVRGVVDLRCGLGCFSDKGLTGLLGENFAAQAAALEADSGINVARSISFSFLVSLPGTVVPGALGVPRPGHIVEWDLLLGQRRGISLRASSFDKGHVSALVALAGLLLLLLVFASLDGADGTDEGDLCTISGEDSAAGDRAGQVGSEAPAADGAVAARGRVADRGRVAAGSSAAGGREAVTPPI